jgi:serine/alanine adding enzyme
MEIKVCDFPNIEYDAFVEQRCDAKMCHLSRWKGIIEKNTSIRAFYLAAYSAGQVYGVFPLSYINSRLFGRYMVSQAFSNYGGVLADSDDARASLFEHSIKLAEEFDCKYIEFRCLHPFPYDLQTRRDKISMYLDLPPNPDELWKSFDPKVRNQVRKAEKSNIVAFNGHLDLLDAFYKVYSVRMHQLGTPAYSRKLMFNILQTFPENSRLFVVRLGDLTIGAGFTIHYNGFVEIPWAATLIEYNSLCPNNLLYWEIMKYYCLIGAKCFDFGRCTVNGPTYQFKKQWGTKPVELYYQYWASPNHKLSIASQNNSKYSSKVKIWKKLPLCITRIVGPYISRQLP